MGHTCKGKGLGRLCKISGKALLGTQDRFEQDVSAELPQDDLTVKFDLGSQFYSFCSTQQCPVKLQSAGYTLVLQA